MDIEQYKVLASKFPVTNNGQEYLVEIRSCNWFGIKSVVVCKNETRKFLGIYKYVKSIEVFSARFYGSTPNKKVDEISLIEMVEKTFDDYNKKLAEKEKIDNDISDFNNWDGNIKQKQILLEE